MFTLFAEPGKYAFHSCPQIADQIKNWTKRQQELKSLMELRATASEKKCDQDAAWASSTVIR